jgi:hypothetical protein
MDDHEVWGAKTSRESTLVLLAFMFGVSSGNGVDVR